MSVIFWEIEQRVALEKHSDHSRIEKGILDIRCTCCCYLDRRITL